MATTYICHNRQTQTELCDYLTSQGISYIKVSACLDTEPAYSVKIQTPIEKEIKISLYHYD